MTANGWIQIAVYCAILIAITTGLQPHGGHTTGWQNPAVLGLLAAGVVLLAASRPRTAGCCQPVV